MIAYNSGDRGKFPVVLSNIGGGYNAGSHEFTCPVSGVYMFSTSTLTGPQAYGIMSIMVNGVRTVTTHADSHGNAWDQGTNMVVVNCDHGQKVWVRSDRDIMVHDNMKHYSTFSGMLLHRS